MEYLNEAHERNFYCLLAEDHTTERDTERRSLLYILSGNMDLYQKRKHLYDSREHRIILYHLDEMPIEFSSGVRALVTLGFHLYNGANPPESNICNIFCSLDEQNRLLAYNAIRIRFM